LLAAPRAMLAWVAMQDLRVQLITESSCLYRRHRRNQPLGCSQTKGSGLCSEQRFGAQPKCSMAFLVMVEAGGSPSLMKRFSTWK